MFITFSQILNGIAKDLTKLGGKTVAKLVTPQEKQVTIIVLLHVYHLMTVVLRS
jgi:hypothetical protein